MKPCAPGLHSRRDNGYMNDAGSAGTDSDIVSRWQGRSLPLPVKAIAVGGLGLLAAAVAYLLITFVLIGLGSLGFGESCNPGC